MLLFLSLHPEQHFKGSQHPLAAAVLLFCGVYTGYRLADLKPEMYANPLRLRLNKIPADFILIVTIAFIFLLIARPGLLFILQFGIAASIAIGYYTISAYDHTVSEVCAVSSSLKTFHWHWPGPSLRLHYIRANSPHCITSLNGFYICSPSAS